MQEKLRNLNFFDELFLKYYNIKVLPQYLKEQVSAHYQEHKDWVMTTDFSDKVKNNFVKVLNGIEKFMMSEDYSTEHLDDFIKITKQLDDIRKQKTHFFKFIFIHN